MRKSRVGPPEHRFWQNVDKSEDCWKWTGGSWSKGYGIFCTSRNDRSYAHRYSYQLCFGAIPKGMMVCHRCDNPSCVRPDHLFLGNAKDNVQDMMDKGRHGTKGRRSPDDQLIAFRVNKLLKAKLDAYCISRGQGMAAVIRCWIDNLPDVRQEPSIRERGGGEGEASE